MQIKQIFINKNVNLSSLDLIELEKIFNLTKKGKYFSIGRTCYYKLIQPVTIKNIIYSYVKIKGCGVLKNKVFIKPGADSFIRKDPHFGLNDDGSPTLVYSDIAPYGGICLSRALSEYNNFKYLYNHKVSTILPLFVYKYENLYFNGESLGISVALCDITPPLRMDKLLYSNDLMPIKYYEFYRKIYYLEFGEFSDLNFDDKAKLINRIANKYAREIRKFANSGLYIHSGGWSNIQYSFYNKNIVLVDLDSSRDIKNKKLSLLLNCRDLISNIYRLLIALYNPNCIKDYDDDIIREKNYVLSLISGFFDTVPEQKIEEISQMINDFYINNCFNAIKRIEHLMLELSEEEVKKYELKIFDFYDYCMQLLYPLFFDYEKKLKNNYIRYKN